LPVTAESGTVEMPLFARMAYRTRQVDRVILDRDGGMSVD
jgi:hypothetical protein